MAEIKNPWRTHLEVNEKPNRNAFDWSFQYNGTFQFGKLYPVFCKKMMPNSSIRVKPVFSLHFMPMYFPVQTRMRAHLHFFRVRQRNLWKDYVNWYQGNRDDLQPPYINFSTADKVSKLLTTSSLGDYLGLPTTFSGTYGFWKPVEVDFLTSLGAHASYWTGLYSQSAKTNAAMRQVLVDKPLSDAVQAFPPLPTSLNVWRCVKYKVEQYDYDENGNLVLRWGNLVPSKVEALKKCVIGFYDSLGNYINSYKGDDENFKYSGSGESFTSVFTTSSRYLKYKPYWFILYTPAPSVDATLYNGDSVVYDENAVVFLKGMELKRGVASTDELTLETSPFYNSTSSNKDKQLKISSFPFRAYESIYNGFYRNILNNPLIINGQPEYNTYCRNTDGGEDNTDYDFYYHNWEDDFLTTALSSPQVGDPVLVGITTNGSRAYVAMRDEEGNAYRLVPKVSEDGTAIEGLDVQEMKDNEPIQAPRSFVDLATTGISITDLRNCNALQRWLETNSRKGLRFRDIIEGHFDCTVRFDELNMPEFIGGISRDVTVNQINQMSALDVNSGQFDDVLGSFAGQAGCYGSSDTAVSQFIDEPSYIIGILSIVPTPNYSQLLPRHFLDRDILDEYFPEFSNISMQPIRYNEVCPIQAYNNSPDDLNRIFGYQRAWYQYLNSVDEVHGEFRKSLRNFLINRVFDRAPELSPDFLTVKPEDCNDVFSVTETTDKILGQIYFDCTAKLPIPRAGIPKLEA